MSAELYIISTPIGNLNDFNNRSIDCLTNSDLILAEDTRSTLRLLNHLGLKKKLVSCNEYNQESRISILEEAIEKSWRIALVSDAGAPMVSDPGEVIVLKAIELGIKVIPVPGPSAFLLALLGSGLDTGRFVFEGFLPDKRSLRKQRLQELQKESRTTILYIAPHDLAQTLFELNQALGNRKATLARELTKKFEEFIRSDLSTLENDVRNGQIMLKGEFVMVLEGNKEEQEVVTISQEQLIELVRTHIDSGLSTKDIVKIVCEQTGKNKKEIYALTLELLEK